MLPGRQDSYFEQLEAVLWRVAAERCSLPGVRDLAMGVKQLSDRYNGLAPSSRDLSPLDRLAWQLFFTLSDAPKVLPSVQELAGAGELPEGSLRVLDLGAGCGAQSLGLLGALQTLELARPVTLVAQDQDPAALHALERTVEHLGSEGIFEAGLSLHTLPGDLARQGALTGLAPSGPYQLILAGSVINELPEPAQLPLLRGLRELLAPRGALIIIEPALRQCARRLHALRDALLAEGATAFAPCTRQGPCPMLAHPRDWCHERLVWNPPPRLRLLADRSGLRRRDLRWSYLALNRHGANLAQARGEPGWRVVSDPMPSKGKLELLLCGPAGLLRAQRLNRHRSPDNEAFGQLHRGQVVRLTGALERDGRMAVGQETAVTPGSAL